MSLFTELTLSEQANLSGGTKKNKDNKHPSSIKVVGVGGDGGNGGDGGFTGIIVTGKVNVSKSDITTGNANGGAGGAGGAGISV